MILIWRHLKHLVLLIAFLGVSPDSFSNDDSESTRRVTKLVRAYRSAHEADIIRELSSLLAIPNHASDAVGIRANALAVAQILQARGVHTTLVEENGSPPVVLGELIKLGATRTVTFYAHYDGQPVDAREWDGDPFVPRLRDRPPEKGNPDLQLPSLPNRPGAEWRLYARSASDDKAAIIAFAVALDALRAAHIAPSVNLRFLLEGEEEVGSPHLAEFLRHHSGELSTDLWIMCDGPVHQSGRAQVVFGARGLIGLELTVYGPNRGLHSGHYGNWAPNPIVLLTHLLDSMRATDGRILIPGFYEDVKPLTTAEERAVGEIPNLDVQLKQVFGLAWSEGEPASLTEQILKPAFNIHGIQAGHIGTAAANVISSEAVASIDIRLVPSQSPEKVRKLVEKHVAEQGFFVLHVPPDSVTRALQPRIAMLVWNEGYPAGRTSIELAVSKAVVEIVQNVVHGQVIRVPALGGSVPMYLFQQGNGRPVIAVPIANYDNNQHAANENIRLQNLWDGIEVFAGLFHGLGAALH